MKKKKILYVIGLLIVLIASIATIAACKGGENPLSLSAPTNLNYDGAVITWNAVENADRYTVCINDGQEYTATTNRHAYQANNSEFKVSVKAVSVLISDKVIASEATVMNFKPLGKVDELRVSESGVVTWDLVDNATAYAVRFNGNSSNVITVVVPELTEIPEGRQSIQVRPIIEGDNSYYSTWSTAKTVTKLQTVAVKDISYADGIIKWPGINGANGGYEVYINDVKVDTVNTTSYEYNAANSSFDVKIKPVGNHIDTFDGAVSESKSFVYLDTVTGINVEDGILRWDEVAGAASYKVTVGSRIFDVTTNSYEGLVAGESSVVKVMPVANGGDSSNYFSVWSTPVTVTILKAPVLKWNDQLELDGEANNNITWDGINQAKGYTVKVTNPDGNEQTYTYGEIERAYANAYLETGVYTVEVKANSDIADGSVSDSKYSAPVKVIRLAAPERVSSGFITSNADSLANGFTVTYKAVTNAGGYVLMRDGESNVLTNSANQLQFHVNDLVSDNVINGQTYTYGIRSAGSSFNQATGTKILGSLSSNPLSFEISILPTPATPTISGYTYSFGAVANSEGYAVSRSGQTQYSEATSFDLSGLEAGTTSVSVCARGNGSTVLPSNYTAAIPVVRLAAPYDIKIARTDNSEGQLGFSGPQPGTAKQITYTVVFENESKDYLVNEIENINSMISTRGTPVHMVANANDYDINGTTYYMTSPNSQTVTFIKLEAPTFGQKAFSNTQFLWNAPTNIGAYSPTYHIYNNKNQNVYNGAQNSEAFDISDFEAGEYQFTIRALGDGQTIVDSDLSEPRTIYKLATPEVRRENGQYVWNGVPDTTSYAVYIDGELAYAENHVSGTLNYSLTPKFENLKDYEVEVFAVGDGGYQTVDSAPCRIEQKVIQLATPEFKLSYDSETYNKNNGNLVVEITTGSDYNKGYAVTVGDYRGTIEEGQTTFKVNPANPGSYTATVFALGGNFDDDGNYYFDSQAQGGSSRYQVTLLGSVNADKIEITTDKVLKWVTVTSAISYEVVYSINGGEEVTISTSNTSTTELIQKLAENRDANTVTVRVRAVGNGQTGTIISGEWVERTFYNQ